MAFRANWLQMNSVPSKQSLIPSWIKQAGDAFFLFHPPFFPTTAPCFAVKSDWAIWTHVSKVPLQRNTLAGFVLPNPPELIQRHKCARRKLDCTSERPCSLANPTPAPGTALARINHPLCSLPIKIGVSYWLTEALRRLRAWNVFLFLDGKCFINSKYFFA